MRIAGREGLRRGVLLLPSLFTLGNLFCGFYSLMQATRGRWSPGASASHFEWAAVFIALAMLADGLDGRVARFAHATTRVQDVLGEHQDATVAGATLARLAAEATPAGSDPAPEFAPAVARLARSQAVAARKARVRFFKVWRKLDRKKRRAWLDA